MIATEPTCPESCRFRKHGCYTEHGRMRPNVERLNAFARMRALDSTGVIADEVAVIDRAWPNGVPQDGGRHGTQGRDLRLHTAGDVRHQAEAELLAGAAQRYQLRGGGDVFTFTHSAQNIDHRSWGPIRALASVEDPADVRGAHSAGYAAAITMVEFPRKTAFTLPGVPGRIVPCPQQTRGIPCVTCRLCMKDDLRALGITIAFAVHGPVAGRARATEALAEIRVPRAGRIL